MTCVLFYNCFRSPSPARERTRSLTRPSRSRNPSEANDISKEVTPNPRRSREVSKESELQRDNNLKEVSRSREVSKEAELLRDKRSKEDSRPRGEGSNSRATTPRSRESSISRASSRSGDASGSSSPASSEDSDYLRQRIYIPPIEKNVDRSGY